MHQLGGSGGKENFTKIRCPGIAYEAISGPKMALNIYSQIIQPCLGTRLYRGGT